MLFNNIVVFSRPIDMFFFRHCLAYHIFLTFFSSKFNSLRISIIFVRVLAFCRAGTVINEQDSDDDEWLLILGFPTNMPVEIRTKHKPCRTPS